MKLTISAGSSRAAEALLRSKAFTRPAGPFPSTDGGLLWSKLVENGYQAGRLLAGQLGATLVDSLIATTWNSALPGEQSRWGALLATSPLPASGHSTRKPREKPP